ncbi:MAG: 50S ribosomal protein L6 [Victivallaceae bacterium]
MSRKAREPIHFPKEVQVNCTETEITVQGPKGTLLKKLMPEVVISIEDNKITVSPAENVVEKPGKFQGLYWALIDNMVKGVCSGFEKKLEMNGVGYRAVVQNAVLDLSIGVSHPVKMPIPQFLEVSVEKNTIILIRGLDKQLVGQFAASIRSKRPPEPYKGKGIRYANEYVRRKAGKTAKTGKK